MPSFAFWKSSKVDLTKTPLLTEDVATEQPSILIPLVTKDLDLNPDGEDAGVFLFDDDAMPLQSPRPDLVLETEPLIASPSAAEQDLSTRESVQEVHSKVKNYSKKLISTDNDNPPAPPPKSSPSGQLQCATAADESRAIINEERSEASQRAQEKLPKQLEPLSSSLERSPNHENSPKRPVPSAMDKASTQSHDRDSGMYVSDDENLPPQSRPASLALSDFNQRSRNASVSSKHTASTSTSSPRQRTDSIARLKRPAELNLGANPVSNSSKPRSELEKRYDLIRNSKTQSKAALRSPTALLQERLNMSTKKERVEEEKTRVFTPPRQMTNGCWLPGPGAQMDAFTSTSVRARTEAEGRPAWWCKVDKLVVFDGVDVNSEGDLKVYTRTSKGLSIARRRGDMETIVIPMDLSCYALLHISCGYMLSLFPERSSSVWIEDVGVVRGVHLRSCTRCVLAPSEK